MNQERESEPSIWDIVDRELSAYDQARRTSDEKRRLRYISNVQTITPPHCVTLFEENEYRIAKNPLTTHTHLWTQYVDELRSDDQSVASGMVSGHLFSIKSDEERIYIRLDVSLNVAPIDISEVVNTLINEGYTVLTPDYDVIQLIGE